MKISDAEKDKALSGCVTAIAALAMTPFFGN